MFVIFVIDFFFIKSTLSMLMCCVCSVLCKCSPFHNAGYTPQDNRADLGPISPLPTILGNVPIILVDLKIILSDFSVV